MKPINQVHQYLTDLKFIGMRDKYELRTKEAQDSKCSYEEFLNLCLYDEIEYRKNQKTLRLIRNAGFRSQSSPEAMDFSTNRGITIQEFRNLLSMKFINNGSNIAIFGPTGVGKSYLAGCIGQMACRHGYTVIFYRMNNLIEKMTLARAQGKYLTHLRKVSGADLLILDDIGIKPLTPQQFQDLYDIFDERYESKATIITSQIPEANWSEIIDDPVTCEAIMDRLFSKAIKITMKGDSYRHKKQKNLDAS